jgi:HPt (histidine-containing phosphotransfer) domain-containing protein
MDMQMPEMDGLEATRQIHRRWSEDDHPYIVAMTANAMESDRQECLAAGMDDYVSKPVRVEALVAALEHAWAALAGRRDRTAQAHEHESAAGHDAPGSNGTPPPGGVQLAGGLPPASVALDAAALANLRAMVGDDASFLAELVNTFLEDAPRLLGDMRAAVAAGDAAALRLAAHSLKSNAAQFGATENAALCREIEGLGKAGNAQEAAALVDAAATAYPGVAAALQGIL